MDVGASLETDTETPEVVQLGMCALDDPANLSETTAVSFPAPGDTGRDAAIVHDASVFVVIVTAIRIDALGAA
ncbi:hypothetical protein VL15_37530, partial [Burkholderia cepacia]